MMEPEGVYWAICGNRAIVVTQVTLEAMDEMLKKDSGILGVPVYWCHGKQNAPIFWPRPADGVVMAQRAWLLS